ncbi:MAG: OadG family protein [Thermodesulfobacteriota bacterium]
MWAESLKVAVIGFSVVFVSLGVLALSVWMMSMFFKHEDKKAEEVQQ